jgi:biotin carboxylase
VVDGGTKPPLKSSGGTVKRLLILSIKPVFTLSIVRTAVLAGYRTYVASDQDWGIDRLSLHGQRRLLLPRESLANGTPEALERINEYIERNGIDLVLAGDTDCTRMLTVHRGAIRGAAVFPMPPVEVFDQLNDKWSFYNLLVAHGIPTPRSQLVTSLDEIDRLDLGYPVMVKPPRGEDSKGVRRVDDRPALLRDLERSAREGQLPLIVQEFIPGPDIDLDLLADRGELVCWLVQQRVGSGMRFPADDRLVALGRAMCRAVQYRGVGHVDMRIDERTDTVLAIEFNPRFWGSLPFASWLGVNFVGWGASLLEPGRPTFTPQKGYCPWLGSTPGTVARWIGRGFRGPGESEAQQRAWAMQFLDPLPEWWDWTAKRLARRKP